MTVPCITRSQLVTQTQGSEESILSLVPDARDQPGVFQGLVLHDDWSGRRVSMAGHHKLWQQLCGYPRQVMRDKRMVPTQRRPDGIYLRGKKVAPRWGHDNLVLWASIGHAKTQTVAVARALWELGNNPRIRILIVMNSAKQAAKTLRSIKNYIEGDTPGARMVHTIFPHLKRGDKWTDQQISVQGVGQPARDYNIECVGRGTKILGARVDLIIVDDVLDQECTYKQAARDKLWDWFTTNLYSRIAGNPDARIWIVGTAWHRDDLMFRFAGKMGRQAGAYSFPIYGPAGRLWPERFDDEAIEKMRRLFGAIEFARMCLCQPITDAATYFSLDWFLEAQRKAIGLDPFIMFDRAHALRVTAGLDLAFSRRDGSDLSALYLLGVERETKRRWPLSCTAGRWSGTEIIDRMCDAHDIWQPSFCVETNAAQKFIAEIGGELGRKTDEPMDMRRTLDIQGMHTTREAKLSMEYGIARMGVEMALGNWRIWSQANNELDHEIREWRRECLTYTPTDHTGDRLIASWLAWLGHVSLERSIAGRHKIPGFGLA